MPTTTEKKALSQTVEQFDCLPDAALIDQKTLEVLLGCGPTSVWRWVKSGDVPRPVRIGLRSNRWRVGDIRALLAKRAAA
ncbi:MAG: hypothetical protein ABF296_10210 [Oceanococcaceae bacterium]